MAEVNQNSREAVASSAMSTRPFTCTECHQPVCDHIADRLFGMHHELKAATPPMGITAVDDSLREMTRELSEQEVYREEIASREAELARTREALRKLRNEVLGICGIARTAIRHEIGNTNFSVLQVRLDEARAALESTTPQEGK